MTKIRKIDLHLSRMCEGSRWASYFEALFFKGVSGWRFGGMTDEEINKKFDAILLALKALRSGQSKHLQKDHADIERQFLLMQKRLSRIERKLGIRDHGLDLQAVVFPNDVPDNFTIVQSILKEQEYRE